MLKVSVIIPTYQHAHFVGQAVESVLAQTYKDYEIIVVDDGSTDNTSEVLAKFGNQITVIYQENRGLSAARNTGIRASHGDLVAFLDADDVWMPAKLEKQVPLFERNERVGLVCCDILFFDESGDRLGTAFETDRPQSGMIHSVIFIRSFIPMPTVIVRRSCFDDVGLFDETLTACEDHDMWLRISKKWAVGFVNEPLAKYRVSANQMHKNPARMLCNMIRVQEKAFADSPKLHELDLGTLDRCFYELYLQLARIYKEEGRYPEARALLWHHIRTHGCKFKYCRAWLTSWAPRWLLNLLLIIRGHIQSLRQPMSRVV